MSVKELLEGNEPRNKKKQNMEHYDNPHQHELEHKKWEMDVAMALTNEMKRNLPKSPSDDDDEQSEDCQASKVASCNTDNNRSTTAPT
jgi:hypothetical protein